VARFPGAQWRPIPVNFNTGRWGTTVNLVVVHHFAGGTLPAVDSLLRNPARQASYHFGVGRNGAIFQWVDTANTAWATGPANARSVAIGHEGTSQPFTDAQMNATASIIRWARTVHRQATNLGGHRQFMATACPGDPMFRELAELNRRASGAAPRPPAPPPPPPPPAPPEETMSLVFDIEGATQLFEVSSGGGLFRRGRQPGRPGWDAAVNMGDGFRGTPAHFQRTAPDGAVIHEVYVDRVRASPVMFSFNLGAAPPRSWQRVNL
jgi:hypothetical protein